MTSVADHYQTLGVMPEAEQIVITAAYRALASRYHPDRWTGDKDEATRMMSKINVAYGVLGDAEKRKAYDAERGAARSTFSESTDEAEAAFHDAIQVYEERWKVACSVYPDLSELRKRLSKTSRALSFNFVVHLLEKKQFNLRFNIAEAMEKSFLERHFGTNPKIIAFAKSLIQLGARGAIRHLNQLVDVLGDSTTSQDIIRAVEEENRTELREKRTDYADHEAEHESEQRDKSAAARERYQKSQELIDEAFLHAEKNGYEISTHMGGFFSPFHLTIKKVGYGKIIHSTDTREKMRVWITQHIR